MKFEKVDAVLAPSTLKFSTFLFVENMGGRGDVVYIGCDCGQLVYSVFTTRASRLEYLLKEYSHSSRLTCLMYSTNKSLSPNAEGMLFSGSRDRAIKVWNPSGSVGKVAVQTCYGHTASITSIVDGHDGGSISSRF